MYAVIKGTTTGAINGDTRSVDHGSYSSQWHCNLLEVNYCLGFGVYVGFALKIESRKHPITP